MGARPRLGHSRSGSVVLVRAWLAAVLVLSLASTASAQASVCTELDDDDVRARTAILEDAIAREEPAVRRWWTSFALLHAVMASGAAILAASAQDEGFRNEMIMGTVSSTLGLATLVVFTPPLMGGGDALRGAPGDTPEERLVRLQLAESILSRAAASTDFLRSWVPATLSSLYVTGAAGTLLLAFQRPTGAILHSVGGAVIGLGRILLHPTGARDRWRRYRRAHPECDPVPSVPPSARIMPHGLGVRVDF